MTATRPGRDATFPIRLLTSSLALTIGVLLALGWSSYDSYRQYVTADSHDLRLAGLRGVIVHLDEVLTMSARMAATTGDPQWERRYREFEPVLDAATKEAVAITDRSASAGAASQTEAANETLVDLENQAFAQVRAGRSADARSILFGDAYETQKKIYADGMATVIKDIEASLATSRQAIWRRTKVLGAATLLAVCLLISTWLMMIGRLKKWRMALSRTMDALRAGTRELEAEVEERKLTEIALRESEGKFHRLADNISDMFWITSPDQETMLYISPGYAEIWGRTVESLHARPHQWMEVILPEDQPQVIAAFARLMDREPKVSVEYRVVRPDGTVRWVLDRGFQIRDDAGNLVSLTGIASDITERKLFEAALWKAHQDLIDSSRQAGMAEVATSVLHNVGNVLNSVNVSCSVVADQVRRSRVGSVAKTAALLDQHTDDLAAYLTQDPTGRKLPQYLGKLAERLASEQAEVLRELKLLSKNIEHIKDIVSMQQNYAKVSGITEIVVASDLVEDSLRMNEGSLQRHTVRVLREYDEVPLITVEKQKALQILVNLIRNAKHACDAVEHAEKQMTVRIHRCGDSVRISVTDNGVGIPPENLTLIFAHGFTTKKDGHGFGLHSGALAAREMGGSLTVHSAGAGNGATFTLELPLTPDATHPERLPS